jgi:hypothetical protein
MMKSWKYSLKIRCGRPEYWYFVGAIPQSEVKNKKLNGMIKQIKYRYSSLYVSS